MSVQAGEWPAQIAATKTTVQTRSSRGGTEREGDQGRVRTGGKRAFSVRWCVLGLNGDSHKMEEPMAAGHVKFDELENRRRSKFRSTSDGREIVLYVPCMYSSVQKYTRSVRVDVYSTVMINCAVGLHMYTVHTMYTVD